MLCLFLMSVQITKNISLTQHLDDFIERRVNSGRYQSASEVVRESLRQMEEREAARDKVREMIEEAWAESERGEGMDGEAFMKAMRQALVKKLKGRKDPRPRARRKA